MTEAGAGLATLCICVAATAGVVMRPLRLPEAVWAVAGGVLLVALGLLPLRGAMAGLAAGLDVYLFLIGMMLLAETARREGLFDWLAAIAAGHARGSAVRLFALVYGIGVVVTALLSNDATAVVLTPAIAAVARAARTETPLPFLLICALVANAASFALPISNPANLVVYGGALPALPEWLARFALPSVLAIMATYWVLRWTERAALTAPVATDVAVPPLASGGRIAALGIVVAAAGLLLASVLGASLGWPTALAGAATAAAVLIGGRKSPWPLLAGVSWSIVPLVAGLFVLVEGLGRTGAIAALASLLQAAVAATPHGAAGVSGVAAAFAANLMNNLPAGLVAWQALGAGTAPHQVRDAVLIGIDLGPNLSVTGSLATILWLAALRREGIHMSAWAFLKVGVLVMPPALLLALGALLAEGWLFPR